MAEYKHIMIQKEENTYSYKGKPYPFAPKPPSRDYTVHGEKLKKQICSSMTDIISKRKDRGIDSDNLIVLELQSEAMSEGVIQLLQNKFNLSVVEEKISEELEHGSNLTVQFDTKNDIDRFNQERQYWEDENNDYQELTVSQRKELFNSIENVRALSRQDRMGKRLKEIYAGKATLPEGFFIVDVDAWYNNDKSRRIEIESQIKAIIGTEGSKLLGDMMEIPGLILGKAQVNEFSLNALLDADIIAHVDLPYIPKNQEQYHIYSNDCTPVIDGVLNDDSPMAAVLDSGVFAANPLLSSCIVAEEDFDNSENTTSDMDGHGTAVAGIVVYGDFDKVINENKCTPTVRICNAKVMHNDSVWNCPIFPENQRWEIVVKNAIEFFYENYGCRIFNLSAGCVENIYCGGRQFTWAALLDDLSRKLDVLIVISAGNVSNPYINGYTSREELVKNARNQLFSSEHRLIDPATSALNITVGSITRYCEPTVNKNQLRVAISAGEIDSPSVFTRIGRGINKAIKPEFMDYGGNYAMRQKISGKDCWDTRNANLLEPTLNNTTDRIFKGCCGTSFAAPHVTNIAARLEKSLERQLGHRPSINLVRAMLGNSAEISDDMRKMAEESEDIEYNGNVNMKQDRTLRLYGYGKVTDKLMYSTEKNVTLYAEDQLDLRQFHLYKIPVPTEFLKSKGNKSIKVSLAYNPITRVSRKEYLANNLWFEVFRKIDEETLAKFKAKKMNDEEIDEDVKSLPDMYKAKFLPGFESICKSTLQQRVWKKGKTGGRDLLNEDEPYIYILVTGKERFGYIEQDTPQDYAVCITFSYDSNENIGLYNKINSMANIVRTREEIKVIDRIRVKKK